MSKTNDNKIKKSGLGARASRRLSNGTIYVILTIITIVWLAPFAGIELDESLSPAEKLKVVQGLMKEGDERCIIMQFFFSILYAKSEESSKCITAL